MGKALSQRIILCLTFCFLKVRNKRKMIKHNLKDWVKSASIRAIKTMAQTAVSLITIGNMLTDFDWLAILSISTTAGIASLLTSFAGLPECEEQEYEL